MTKPYLFILSLPILLIQIIPLFGNCQVPTVNSIYDANGKPAMLNGPNGKLYKIDFWTDPSEPSAEGNKALVANCNDNHFTGKDRKAAKTSRVTKALYRSFVKISDIIHQLPSDNAMATQVTKTSPRITIEKKGVILDNAYLYAFKRESDNDYHLIIGDNQDITKATLLNMEISGLPRPDNPDLDNSRIAFLSAFKINDKTCMSSYLVFVGNPVPIHVEGSVFYDIDHKPGTIGPVQGTLKLRPRTSWEVHPITNFSLR